MIELADGPTPSPIGPYHRQYGERAARWRRDPFAFFHEALGIDGARGNPELTPDQRALVQAILDHKFVACTAGHGTGKSYVAAALVLWFLSTNPDSRVVTTSASWELVENVLWREIADLYEKSVIPLGGQLLNTSLEYDNKWIALGLSTDNPTRFQGKHAGRVFVLGDEATGIAQEIFEAAESLALSDDDRILMQGNPTDPTSAFYVETTQKKGKWHLVEMSCLNHPNVLSGEQIIPGAVTRGWVDQMRRDYGEDSPVWEARVLGHWSLKLGRMFPDFDARVPGRHIYDPSVVSVPGWWPGWIAIDWGFAHNSAALFARFDGRITYIVDELVVNEKTAGELGSLIGQMANPLAFKGMPSSFSRVFLAHDAFSRSESVRTRAQQMADALEVWGIPAPTPASRDRIGGWNLITSMLRSDTLRISATCENLITKIKNAFRDPKKPEDLQKIEGDDELDALYKLVASSPEEPSMPYELRISQRVTATDPHTRAMQARIAEAEERAASGPAFVSMRRAYR